MSFTGQATAPSIISVAGPTFDSSDSAPPPSIAPTVFTIITNPSSLSSVPTAVTLTTSPSSGSSGNAASTNTSKVSTGVVAGIVVGVFAALAIGLVFLMSVRHKRKMARRPKGNRKSWNKLDDGAASGGPGHVAPPGGRKGTMTDVPMRNVMEKNTASPRSPLPAGPVPFQNIKNQSDSAPIAPIITDHPYSQNVRHVSNNPPGPTTSPYTKHPYAVDLPQTTQAPSSQPSKSQNQPPGEDGTNNNNIPNPFLSRSPSNSSAYHSLYNTTSADHHDAYASALSAFPAVQMALRLNSVASSNDYSEDKSPSPTQSHHPHISSTYLDAEHQHDFSRKSYESLYEQYASDSRPPTTLSSSQPRIGAIQDIISALDTEEHPPTTWKDGNINRGSSRLSLGDDQLGSSTTFNPERSHDPGLEINKYPSPPRANGNDVTRNPFADQI